MLGQLPVGQGGSRDFGADGCPLLWQSSASFLCVLEDADKGSVLPSVCGGCLCGTRALSLAGGELGA